MPSYTPTPQERIVIDYDFVYVDEIFQVTIDAEQQDTIVIDRALDLATVHFGKRKPTFGDNLNEHTPEEDIEIDLRQVKRIHRRTRKWTPLTHEQRVALTEAVKAVAVQKPSSLN